MRRKTIAASLVTVAILLTAFWLYSSQISPSPRRFIAKRPVDATSKARERRAASYTDVTGPVVDDVDTNTSYTRRLPGVIIIGAKKAGTRALLQWLKMHPDIVCSKKEAHFFDNKETFDLGLDHYRSLMPPAPPGLVIIEKTPNYLVSKDTPQRIHDTMPATTKFIVILREPVTRAISDFTQSAIKFGSRQASETEVFRSRILKRCSPAGNGWCVNQEASLIRIGRYVLHLRVWFRYFGRGRFYLVDGRRLALTPVQVLQEVEHFLNIRRYFNDSMFYFNQHKGFFCRDPLLMPGTNGDGCLGNTKGREHVQPDDKTLRKLRDFYKPLNRQLEILTGQKYNWKYD